MLLLRSLSFYLLYWPLTIVYGSFAPLLLLLPKPYTQKFVLSWNSLVVAALRLTCGIRYQVRGNTQPLPRPCVVVANHQSAWETFFLQVHYGPLCPVLKKELLSIPFFGWGVSIADPIAIDRGNPVKALKQVQEKGTARLRAGHSVLVFPEGTRMPVGELGNFTRSGAQIAQKAGVPLIAIAHDAGNYWRNKGFFKYPGTIQVSVSDPIDVSDKNTKKTMQDIRCWMQEQIGGPSL